MSIKALFEFLEKAEGGKEIAEGVKGEIEKLRDAEAKNRKMEGENKTLAKQLEELAKIKEKLEASGLDPDNLPKPKAPGDGGPDKSAYEKELAGMKAKMDKLALALDASEKARQESERKAQVEKLRNDFGVTMRETFGKAGDLLTENLIARNALKFDEAGSIVYETGDKILDRDTAVETLKTEYKELLAAKPTGSNAPPPPRGTPPGGPPAGKSVDEMMKMSPQQLFALGLQLEGGAAR
jgi:DNA-binding protein H-NS